MNPSKTYQTGLIVGKFCPLHKGHQHLIETAYKSCRSLIIISYAKPSYKGCEGNKRYQWLSHLYPSACILVVDDEWLASQMNCPWQTVPHDDEPEERHRHFTSWLCVDVLKKRPDAVFTSEDYGYAFSQFLGQYISQNSRKPHQVDNICVDKSRKMVPISGTEIRHATFDNRAFLDPFVYKFFVKRILILGGESTGKSTLCAALAEKFSTRWAAEYGRELWLAKNGQLSPDDLLTIAKTQIAREDTLSLQSKEFLFCDTSPLTTQLYSEEMFSAVDPSLKKLAKRHYDYVFLCDDDFKFVQDGTRKDSNFRSQQQEWYKFQLHEQNIPYTLLNGNLHARCEHVSTYLTKVFAPPFNSQEHVQRV